MRWTYNYYFIYLNEYVYHPAPFQMLNMMINSFFLKTFQHIRELLHDAHCLNSDDILQLNFEKQEHFENPCG